MLIFQAEKTITPAAKKAEDGKKELLGTGGSFTAV